MIHVDIATDPAFQGANPKQHRPQGTGSQAPTGVLSEIEHPPGACADPPRANPVTRKTEQSRRRRGRRYAKSKRPRIKLPNGDELCPVFDLAAELGVSERTVIRMKAKGLRIGRHGGVAYASRNQAIQIIAAGVLGETPPRKRRRR